MSAITISKRITGRMGLNADLVLSVDDRFLRLGCSTRSAEVGRRGIIIIGSHATNRPPPLPAVSDRMQTHAHHPNKLPQAESCHRLFDTLESGA